MQQGDCDMISTTLCLLHPDRAKLDEKKK